MIRANSYIAIVLSMALIWSGSPQTTWASPNDQVFEDLLERVGFDSEKGDATAAIDAVTSYVRQETYRLDDNETLKVLSDYVQASIDFCKRPIHSEKSIRACYEAAKLVSVSVGEKTLPYEMRLAQTNEPIPEPVQTQLGPAEIALFVVLIGIAFVFLKKLARGPKLQPIEELGLLIPFDFLKEKEAVRRFSNDAVVLSAIFRARLRYLPVSTITKQCEEQKILLRREDLYAMTDTDLADIALHSRNMKNLDEPVVQAINETANALLKVAPYHRLDVARSLAASATSATNTSASSYLIPLVAAASALDAISRGDKLTPQEIADLRARAEKITMEAVDQQIDVHRATHGFLETFTPENQ